MRPPGQPAHTMDLVYSYSAFLISYLIGSVSFAIVISRLMGLGDPRHYGSKNPGATNVLRTGNKKAAALTLLLDAAKGYLPVALVQWYSFELGFEDTTIAFVGVAAFIGHLFPVYFRFRGGKGVATAMGVLLAYEPVLGASVIVTWLVMAALFRYASLASIVAALFAPFVALLFFERPSMALGVTVMSLLLIWRHWRNIMNLAAGKEPKLGAKPVDPGTRKHKRRVRRLHDDVAPDTHSGARSNKGK